MIKAEEARKGLVVSEVVNWRTLANGRLSKVFTLIKNTVLEEIDLKIRRASVVNQHGESSKKTGFSLHSAYTDISNHIASEVSDGTISEYKENPIFRLMKKELELVVCAELRQAGYKLEVTRFGAYIDISWEE